MKLCFMLAQRNTGAVAFSPQQATERISYLATETFNFANCFVFRFVLESLAFLNDNLVYPGTAMPNVLIALQGNQKLVCKDIPVIAKNGGEKRDDLGNTITKEKCGYLKVAEGSGELTKDEFDTLIYDLTNFLVYVGEPAKATRERMGWYVIFYFLIFTALSALLYREYHKDYH